MGLGVNSGGGVFGLRPFCHSDIGLVAIPCSAFQVIGSFELPAEDPFQPVLVPTAEFEFGAVLEDDQEIAVGPGLEFVNPI